MRSALRVIAVAGITLSCGASRDQPRPDERAAEEVRVPENPNQETIDFDEEGNISPGESQGAKEPLTRKEMEEAEPLPIPEVPPDGEKEDPLRGDRK